MLLILVYMSLLYEWMFAFLLCGTSEIWRFWLNELAGMVGPSKFFIFVFFNVKRWCSSSLLVGFYFLFAAFPVHLLLRGCGQVSKQAERRGQRDRDVPSAALCLVWGAVKELRLLAATSRGCRCAQHS